MKLTRIGQSWGLGRFIFLIVFTVAMTSLGIWQVRRQYEVVAQGYAIDRDLFEYRRLLERQKRLNLMLSAYKDPSALMVFAEEELGMRKAGREDALFIPDPRHSTPLTRTLPPASSDTPSTSSEPTSPEHIDEPSTPEVSP